MIEVKGQKDFIQKVDLRNCLNCTTNKIMTHWAIGLVRRQHVGFCLFRTLNKNFKMLLYVTFFIFLFN